MRHCVHTTTCDVCMRVVKHDVYDLRADHPAPWPTHMVHNGCGADVCEQCKPDVESALSEIRIKKAKERAALECAEYHRRHPPKD